VKLAFVGYGALGRYIEATVKESESVVPSEVVYFDDALHRTGVPHAFSFDVLSSQDFREHRFYVCLGYKHLIRKQQIVDQLLELRRDLPSFVHASSYVHPSVKIGAGSFIYPGCSLDRGTTIGNGTWITNADVIAHDCVIGDCCWFGATVTLSGHVKVGNATFLGSGTTVANDVHVGSRVIVGTATAVTKNIADDASAIGNPMRILDRPLRLV
jgi:sugar O-acyltransferase (sialic acid O-acetyltransferase NeuD family)